MTWLAAVALKLSPVGRFLKAVPWQVWAAIGLAVALWLGVQWHQHEAGQALEAAEKRGEDRAYANVEAKAKALEEKARELAQQIRSRTDETNRRIAGDADDLRLRGPGRAACPVAPPAGAGGRDEAGGAGDAAGPQMPSGDRAAVPWGWLVDRAEQCDLNRAEALAWREWRRRYTAEWEKWRAEARPE